MSEYIAPCITGDCPTIHVGARCLVDSLPCESVRLILKNAGGDHFLEQNHCPMGALSDVENHPSEEAAELRTKLGITTAYSRSEA